jgi:hypothetical protein
MIELAYSLEAKEGNPKSQKSSNSTARSHRFIVFWRYHFKDTE